MAVDDLSDGVGGQVGSLGDLDIRNAVVVALFPQRVDDMYMQLIHCGLFFDWGVRNRSKALSSFRLTRKIVCWRDGKRKSSC